VEEANAGAGLAFGDVVGDERRLRVFAVDPESGDDEVAIGEAFQGEDGLLAMTGGILSDPVYAKHLRAGAMHLDMSTLEFFHASIARSAFFRAEFVES